MIKNIVFDMGGVLIDFDPERMINDNIPSEYHDIILEKVFRSRHWKNMDKGTESVEEALSNMLSCLPQEIHENIRHMILDREGQMPPIKEMTPIIEALHRSGYRLFVLSNVASWFHEFKYTIPRIEYFEGFFVSADYKMLKPDSIIFETFLKEFSLKAEECLFIDDSPANTDSAAAVGFNTFCFENKDFEGLRKYISNLSKE